MMNNSITLKVGDVFHLKRGKDRIRYAGIVSEDVFSIVQEKKAGYQGFACILYFPSKTTQMTIDGINLGVESVSPEKIVLRVVE
jgi:hypothetical protein